MGGSEAVTDTQASWLDTETAAIVQMYVSSCLSLRQTGAAIGRSAGYVARRLDAAGYDRRPASSYSPPPGGRRTPPTAPQVTAMARAYEQGSSLAAVGSRYGMSDTKAGRILREAGVQLRPRGGTRGPRRPGPSVDKVRQLKDQGLTVRETAEQLKCSEAAVYKARQAAGIRGRAGRPLPPPEQLRADYDREGSVHALRARYHVSQRRLRPALAAAGVELGASRRNPAALTVQLSLPWSWDSALTAAATAVPGS